MPGRAIGLLPVPAQRQLQALRGIQAGREGAFPAAETLPPAMPTSPGAWLAR